MNQTIKFTALMIIACLTGIANVAAAGTPATDFLKKKDQKLKPLLANADKNQDKILKVINSMMDFDALCKDSLGTHWAERTEDEQKKFKDTLKQLIEKNLIKRLKNSKNNTINYTGEAKGKKGIEVKTAIKDPSDPRADAIEVVYVMRKKGNSFLVIDMITDGASLVGNYRDQFNKHINKDGWDGLMKKMTDKLNEK